MKNIKIALIGAGYWGKNLLRNLYDLKVLSLVCDINRKTLAEYKKKYPDLHYSIDNKKALNDPNIHGICIATPAATHYKIARQALLAGKDVFTEKPLALNEEEGRELVELADKKKKILMVGHLLQYHPAIIKLKELVNKSELGEIHYIYSNRLNIGKLRNEENILWSFAPHDISVILMLMNKFPEKINAVGSAYIQPHIYDVTITHFEFDNGIKGHVYVSWLHPIKEQKLVVIGNKKMAVFNDISEKKLFLYPHKIKWKNLMPIALKAEAEEIKIDKTEPLKNECMAFLQAIQTRKEPLTNGKEGLKVLKFIKKAEGSAKTSHSLNKSCLYYVHPTADVEEGACIARNTKIWHFSHVMKGAQIGENCNIGQNVFIDKKAVIGKMQ